MSKNRNWKKEIYAMIIPFLSWDSFLNLSSAPFFKFIFKKFTCLAFNPIILNPFRFYFATIIFLSVRGKTYCSFDCPPKHFPIPPIPLSQTSVLNFYLKIFLGNDSLCREFS